MRTLFERNMLYEEIDPSNSMFDEIVIEEKDYLSIPLEKVTDYFLLFKLMVDEVEIEESNPNDFGSPDTWTLRVTLNNPILNPSDFNRLEDDLEQSEYIDSSTVSMSNLTVLLNFSVEIELD